MGEDEAARVAGISNFLESCNLRLLQPQAEAWCLDQGFESLADVVEVSDEMLRYVTLSYVMSCYVTLRYVKLR